MNYFWAVVLQIVLIFLNAVFACAEIAVISMNETKLSILAQKGGKSAKKAKKLAKLTQDPARFLSTIQVAITLAGFLGSAFAADMFAEPLSSAIIRTGIGISAGVIESVCVILVTLILAFFNIVFGELVPKRVAMKKAEGVATKLTGILGAVSVLFKPIVFLLSVSTNGVLKLFGISPDDKGEEVTEDDIIMMAEVGTENGSIETEENEMIKNIFEFSDLTIGEICTHRKDVDIVFTTETEDEWKKTIYDSSHTYYPVCGESADDIVGVLYTKEYFRLEDSSRESVLKNAVITPMFIYENVPANKVFEKMKKTHEYFAIVLDEYGGMTGIVTIHDLLEAIVGDMDEKGEDADYTIEKLDENLWEINGVAPFDKVEDALGITIERQEDDDIEYETFNGFVGGLTITIPQDGEIFEVCTDQLKINVLTIEKQCITKIQISVLKRDDEE